MRPSLSVTLEPGLERGVPWGRDLYTFVTSAAGHMMRTLQKPRKSRPSKRQVNHRRFLHNMIQRKFADIEASNHRLSSALYDKEEDSSVSSLPSQKPETLDQSGIPSEAGNLQDPDKCSLHKGADDISNSKSVVSVGPHETEISEKKQPELGHLWKRQPKSQSTTCTARKNKESRNEKLEEITSMSSLTGMDCDHKSELFQSECYEDESQLDNSSEDSQQDSSFIQSNHNVDISPPFSPELSPLSLDSYDFSIQTFKDVLTQKNVAEVSESQWTDITDLFSVDSKELVGCMDVEAYLESICAYQDDAGQEVSVDDVGFKDQSDSFTKTNRSEVEDLQCETGDYRYECGYSFHGDQGLTGNHFQRLNKDTAETQFDILKPSFRCPYNTSELQTYQQSPCLLVSCENNQNFTPFEGVAQSFSVPLHNPENRPILTPPHEDDWLFTDILKDRKSPHC